jgi:arsenate reductase-like glutaredoxin family protein
VEKLQALVKRIQDESLRLSNLRSTEATLLTRIDLLDKLAADIKEMISDVERNKRKLSDLPIKASDADAFLDALDETSGNLPPLLTPNGSSKNSEATTPSNPSMANVQALLENAKYLKWGVDINIAYDPEVKQREKALQLLESIEKNLTKHAVSETPLSRRQFQYYMKQLNALQFLSSASKKHTPIRIDPFPIHSTRLGGEAEYPTAEQVNTVQGDGFGPSSYDSYGIDKSNLFPKPGDSSADTRRRPGYTMNTEAIEHRGSASSFDPAAVGGPDYKKRSLDLCKQIQGAQLGDPANFGCISNPDEVSSSYSWKGNYQMVCNRLGDTWGGWYPEMFGCPKLDPTTKFQANVSS